MIKLILGLLFWSDAHFFKRLVPKLRAQMGEPAGKALATVLSLLGLGLMIWGFRTAEVVQIWQPPLFLRHVNNLLMLVAVYVFGVGYVPGFLRTKIRHPMLAGVKTWALAHLLVNGDLAGMVLFAGLLAWAVVQLILINRSEPDWKRPAPGPVRNDLIWVVGALMAYAAIGVIHGWLGPYPFG